MSLKEPGLRVENPRDSTDGSSVDVRSDANLDRVIRPAAVVHERAAREIVAWLKNHDVSVGGCWEHGVGYIKRFSGPFDGPSGMRGSSVLLGSLHITWDKYDVTIYRVSITDTGVARGLTVDRLCDEVLGVAGLTLASCPRAPMVAAPLPDPFRSRSAIERIRQGR